MGRGGSRRERWHDCGLSPEITVAINLDWDHPDHYRQLSDLQAAFVSLFQRTRGTVLLNDACALSAHVTATSRTRGAAGATSLATADLRPSSPVAIASPAISPLSPKNPQAGPTVLTFGRTGDFQGRIESERDETLLLALTGRFPTATVSVRARGEFNASNATAALAAQQLMGATFSANSLAGYPGVRRRQSLLHVTADLTVLEDYAHHPAEIRALLTSLRSRAPGRVLAVFQPHRFSRTAQFKAEFAASLASADRVYVLDVYGAGENPLIGGTSADLYSELKAKAPSLSVSYCPGAPAAVLAQLSRDVRKGDLIAFIGAGDIDQHARSWIASLNAKAEGEKRWDEFAAKFRAHVSAETKVKREESLAEKTTLRVGGAARIYAEPASIEDTRALLVAANAAQVPIHVLGRGSNLVVPDEGVNGLVLSFAHPHWQRFEPRADGMVWVGAGLRLKNLCGLATKAGLVGFEFLEGIPGNVGGALRMNAGAMGGWTFDVVAAVQLITRSGELRLLQKSDMHVDYRHCEELNEGIALGALLQPKAASESGKISAQIETYREKRQKSQPREPSAGCIFKNPEGNSAGKLIDEAGLKGERVGDAEVSSIHANFIVNRGHATSSDVIELVRRVRARVEQVKGIRLEPEVLLYGMQWKDVL